LLQPVQVRAVQLFITVYLEGGSRKEMSVHVFSYRARKLLYSIKKGKVLLSTGCNYSRLKPPRALPYLLCIAYCATSPSKLVNCPPWKCYMRRYDSRPPHSFLRARAESIWQAARAARGRSASVPFLRRLPPTDRRCRLLPPTTLS
jgi:hypothetical protein